MKDWADTFGYKMAWLAIKNANTQAILQTLRLPNPQVIGWDEGIEKIYENHGNIDAIFVTPQINGWSFVVGWYFFDLNFRDGDIKKLKNYTAELSKVFEEVQAFATYRVSEYHHWILARGGKIVRCFAFSGDSGKILCNDGELTDAEKQLPWGKLESFQWLPDEQGVMIIAEKWSINPTKISNTNLNDKICYITNIPSL